MIEFSALQLLLVAITAWLDRRERVVVAYLIEENRVLRRQLGGRRPRLTNDDRQRLGARAHRLGRQALREVATIVTPDNVAPVASDVLHRLPDRPGLASRVDRRLNAPFQRALHAPGQSDAHDG